MSQKLRVAVPVALALSLSGCAGLLGGGAKAPPWLLTLTPQAPAPESISRTAGPGEAVTIDLPVVPKEVKTNRIPVHSGPTAIAYVKDLTWVDTPDKLFQNLLEETVRRTTNRVVVDPNQTGLDAGVVLHGELERFGYDAQTGQVTVAYNGSLSSPDGTQVQTRRFVATAPADGTGPSVGPALNHAANEVAQQVAQWIGG